MRHPPIVAIQGGLGNQLFQWFFAHRISEDSQFSLFPKIPTRPVAQIVYDLGLDPLISRCSHCKELQTDSRNPMKNGLIPRLFDYLWNVPALSEFLHAFGYFHEDPRASTRAHRSPPRRIRYANGYFQKWRYIESQREIVSSELMPILEKTFEDLKSRFDFDKPYSVLHVRRGDYRTDQNPETMIGSLSDEYFIEWARQFPSDRIVLLAEHRVEVEDLVSTIKPFLVLDNTSTTALETLAIMSSASFLLGSNSSLSWWGAWTSFINGGTVYLPSHWDEVGRFNSSDFHFPGCYTQPSFWETF